MHRYPGKEPRGCGVGSRRLRHKIRRLRTRPVFNTTLGLQEKLGLGHRVNSTEMCRPHVKEGEGASRAGLEENQGHIHQQDRVTGEARVQRWGDSYYCLCWP